MRVSVRVSLPARTARTRNPGECQAARDHQAVVEFDASPWGRGGGPPPKITRTRVRCSHVARGRYVASSTPQRATPSGNLVTLFLLGTCGDATIAVLLGDKVAALQDAISLKGKGMLIVAREIAWRRVRHRWHFRCEHLPAESNAAADSLSRLSAIPAKAFPTEVAHAPAAHHPRGHSCSAHARCCWRTGWVWRGVIEGHSSSQKQVRRVTAHQHRSSLWENC